MHLPSLQHRAVCRLPWVALYCLFSAAGWLTAQQSNPAPDQGKRAPIPEDLVGDEHVREEFGVNEFTTPSIRKLFEMLDSLGNLPYDEVKRPVPDKTPGDRIALSLGLGTLIADGFLVVQCQRIEPIENVGRALLKYAKSLGAGTRMNRHTQSIFEHSLKGNWNELKDELAMTQVDVEADMVQLRDVDIAHLISLGGWVRAFEIATKAVKVSYAPERTRNLGRRDIVEYYLMSLETLHPDLQEKAVVKDMRKGLEELLPLVDVPEGKELSPDEVTALNAKAEFLLKAIESSTKAS